MTPPEIHSATAQLRALADPLRLRVTRDPEGWPRIPGRNGRLEWHTADTLAAYTTGSVTRRRLLAFPGGRPHQVGDRECRVLAMVDQLPTLGRLLGARKRRPVPVPPGRRRPPVQSDSRTPGIRLTA